MTPDTLSIPQACERLGISKQLGYRLAKTGRLCDGVNVVWFGSTPRVPVAQVEAVLAVSS